MHHKCLLCTDVGWQRCVQRAERALTIQKVLAWSWRMSKVEGSFIERVVHASVKRLCHCLAIGCTELFLLFRGHTDRPLTGHCLYLPVHIACSHPSAVSMTPTAVTRSCCHLFLKEIVFNCTLCFVTIFSPSGLVENCQTETAPRQIIWNELKCNSFNVKICWFIWLIKCIFDFFASY